jgi:hypothetical protein
MFLQTGLDSPNQIDPVQEFRVSAQGKVGRSDPPYRLFPAVHEKLSSPES